MRPRPGRYARDLRTLRVTTCAGCARDMCATSLLCARRACYVRDELAMCAAAPTTWALRAQCALDLGSGCAHYAPNPVL